MGKLTKHTAATPLSVRQLLCGTLLSLAACSPPSGENANQTAENKAASSVAASTAKATSAAAASSILPAGALAAWEKRAGCSAKEARAVPSRWAAYPSVRNDETVIDLYERHFAKYSGGFVIGDFNGDGQQDFVIVAPSGCGVHDPDERMDYGSRGGPPTDFVISSPSGYRAIEGFQSFIDASMIRRRGNKDVLEYNMGGYNGSCGYIETSVWGWNGNQMVVVELRNDKGQIVDKEGCPVRTQAAAVGPARFPPVPKGYYAVGTTCAQATSPQAANDGPNSLAHFDERGLTWFDGGPEIRGFESLGNNRFRVRARSYGNGDDTKGTSADFVIRVTGPSSFVTEPGSPLFDRKEGFTHCPANSVPKAVSGWFEG